MSGIFKNNSSTPRRTSISVFGHSSSNNDFSMDNSYTMGLRSPSLSMAQGSGGLASSSPGHGRSLRDYEEKMSAFRKDNFNLKLRIYFLEEKLSGLTNSHQTSDGSENLFKQNIDLKVENGALKEELQEKQDLLCQAAKALTLMEETEKKAHEEHQALADEQRAKIEMLETEIKALEQTISTDRNKQKIQAEDESVYDYNEEVMTLKSALKEYENQFVEMCATLENLGDLHKTKDQQINVMENTIKELNYENAELKDKLDNNVKNLEDAQYEIDNLNQNINKQSNKIILLLIEHNLLKEKVNKYELEIEQLRQKVDERDLQLQEQNIILVKNIQYNNKNNIPNASYSDSWSDYDGDEEEGEDGNDANDEEEEDDDNDDKSFDNKEICDMKMFKSVPKINHNICENDDHGIPKFDSNENGTESESTNDIYADATDCPHTESDDCHYYCIPSTVEPAAEEVSPSLNPSKNDSPNILHFDKTCTDNYCFELPATSSDKSDASQTHSVFSNPLFHNVIYQRKNLSKSIRSLKSISEEFAHSDPDNLIVQESDSLQDQLTTCKKDLEKQIETVEELNNELEENSTSYKNACRTIQKCLERIKELQTEVSALKQQHQNKEAVLEKTQMIDDETEEFDSCDYFSVEIDLKNCEIKELRETIKTITINKDTEIERLKLELKKKTSNLQSLVNNELWEKNREIEHLNKVLNVELQNKSAPNDSFKQLQSSFNETQYNEALERNKYLQNRLDTIIKGLSISSDKNHDAIIQTMKQEIEYTKNEMAKSESWRKECANVCQVLTCRLEELAGFLDSLLKHKDITGSLCADRRRAIRKAVDKSLNLSRSLTFSNLSATMERFSLDNTNVSDHGLTQLSGISQFLDMTDSSNLFNEKDAAQTQMIETLQSEIKLLRCELEKTSGSSNKTNLKKDRKNLPLLIDPQSESEAWSEPDRDVSQARIGLEDSVSSKLKFNQHSSTSDSDTATQNMKLSIKKADLTEKIVKLEQEILQRDAKLKEENVRYESLQRSMATELDNYRRINDALKLETEKYVCHIKELEENESRILMARDDAKINLRVATVKLETLRSDYTDLEKRHKIEIDNILTSEHARFENMKKELKEKHNEMLKQKDAEYESNLKEHFVHRDLYNEKLEELCDIKDRLDESNASLANNATLQKNLLKQIKETEMSVVAIQKKLDESTLQISKAVLDRSKALNEKTKLEDELQALNKSFTQIKIERESLQSQVVCLQDINATLQNRLLNDEKNMFNPKSSGLQSGYVSEDMPGTSSVENNNDKICARLENSSPDLGIESGGDARNLDQHNIKLSPSLRNLLGTTDIEIKSPNANLNSSIEDNNKENILHDCAKVDLEMIELKRRLRRTHRAFVETFEKLRVSNQRKEQVERDIRQQILKTQNVLKNVRVNMETEMEHKKF